MEESLPCCSFQMYIHGLISLLSQLKQGSQSPWASFIPQPLEELKENSHADTAGHWACPVLSVEAIIPFTIQITCFNFKKKLLLPRCWVVTFVGYSLQQELRTNGGSRKKHWARHIKLWKGFPNGWRSFFHGLWCCVFRAKYQARTLPVQKVHALSLSYPSPELLVT